MTVLHDSGQYTMNHSLRLPPVRVRTFQGNALQLIFFIHCIYGGCWKAVVQHIPVHIRFILTICKESTTDGSIWLANTC